jgi:chloramphenicol 3-O-phosphotransferase
VEPRPLDRGPGRIIFLNGASSSGKSSLAKALQQTLPEPFLHVSSDHLAASGMLPARRGKDGPFAWQAQMRPRFFAGFHRCLPALAAAGNDLIVEQIIEFPAWRTDLPCSSAAWMSSSSACTATWQRSTAANAPGQTAVPARAGPTWKPT